MWNYASLRSIVTNQSSDLICGTICLKVNILNLSCITELFRTRISKMGRNPPSFFGTMKYRRPERRPELANRQEVSELTALKPSSEGAGIPRPLHFRVDLEICARRRPLHPEAEEVSGLAERSPEDTEGRRTS